MLNGYDNCRIEVITKLFNQENFEDKEEILNELDIKLLQSAEDLNSNIDEYISPEIEKLLIEYKDILEPHSKRFLRSSSSIYEYYKDKNYEHFDYSMPGSGLWKLIELELNTSFSWSLRIKSNVCNSTCPWINISSKSRSITQELINGKKVKLNQFEKGNKNRLQGLMLGAISLLLNDSVTIEEFGELSDDQSTYLSIELSSLVNKIINLRNEHAHIRAMSIEKYMELDLLLFDESNGKSNLQKLLDYKRRILSNISK